jgi:hypothetical protein
LDVFALFSSFVKTARCGLLKTIPFGFGLVAAAGRVLSAGRRRIVGLQFAPDFLGGLQGKKRVS